MGNKAKGKSQPVKFLLVRHGETYGNLTGTIQDPETQLTDKGLLQAKMLAQWLATTTEFHPVGLLASDYSRARVTAETVQKATGIELTFNELLRERNFGDFRGCSYEELVGAGINPLDEAMEPPNGESWVEFRSRVDQAFSLIAETAKEVCGNSEGTDKSGDSRQKVLVIVSHGLVIGDMMSRKVTCPSHVDNTQLFRMKNTAVSSITIDEADERGFRAEIIGSTSHLKASNHL